VALKAVTEAFHIRRQPLDVEFTAVTVLTAGETMALLDPLEAGVPRAGMPLTLRFAGAESNFAVALARLGVRVTWISRLGNDPLGDMIHRGLEHEGVDLRWVRRDNARTGVFLKWRNEAENGVVYYRAGSAAARLAVEDVPDEALDGVRLVHLTGITMAISESGRELVLDLARRAHERGAIVLFDPNFRPALPDTREAAAARQREVLPFVDWYLCGEAEAQLLWKGADIPARTVIRVGARGAVVDGIEVSCPRRVEIVDEIGAGDAFAAGFAYGLLHGWAPEESAHAGNVLAAHALSGTGDWETLPRLDEVAAELRPAEHSLRA
jgi:2-dehydro-3-deoxygluconokinase